MTTIPSRADFYEMGKAEMLAQDAATGQNRLRDSSFVAGSMVDLYLQQSATMAEQSAAIALELYLKLRLGTAEREDLDILVADRTGLLRQGLVPSVATIRFSRPASGSAVTIDEGTLVAAGEVQFATTSATTLTGTFVDVPAAAVLGGTDGNVDAATITTLITALSDTTVTVSNPAPAAGGMARETDGQLRARVRGFARTLRKGIPAAVLQAALNYPGVVNAGVDETSDPPVLFIGDVNGTANAVLIAGVLKELDDWRPLGVIVSVQGAVLVNTALTISLTLESGSNFLKAVDLAKKAIEAYGTTLQIGQILYRAKIVAAAVSVEGVANCTVAVPAGDVVPQPEELFRLPFSTITVS